MSDKKRSTDNIYVSRKQLSQLIIHLTDMLNGECDAVRLKDPDPLEEDMMIILDRDDFSEVN